MSSSRKKRRARGPFTSAMEAARRLALWLVILALGGAVAVVGVSTFRRHVPDLPATPEGLDKKAFCVSVLNGNGRHGEAGVVATTLRSRGFQVENILNAERQDYARTIVVDRVGDPERAEAVSQALGGAQVVLQRENAEGCAVQVIVGHDWSDPGDW